jgi:hypothetical protein
MGDDTMLGWHFLRSDRRLRFPPHTPVEVGQTLVVEPPLKMCWHGLHASRRPLDALAYAPEVSGLVVCRVRLSGTVQHDSDKAVATHRTVLAMTEADRILGEFACWCATTALVGEITAGRAVDPRSWMAVDVTRCWLRGQATDAQRAVARAQAWAAAGAAAEAPAATAAAGAAAWAAAAGAAGCVAARAAAWAAAAGAAGCVAARAAAWAEMNTELEARLLTAMGLA